MDYNGNVYRPPVEAGTYLLPVTEGCTHNSCTFCNMYQDIPFRMLSMAEVEAYLREVTTAYPAYSAKIKRVYLVGADPFALSAPRLLERIELIKKYLPQAKAFPMYARTDNIAAKSDADLIALKEAGVDDLYLGVECGLSSVLAALNKGYSAEETKEQCLRLNAAGIHHSDLLMLGTAGTGRGQECAAATAALENEIKPTQILVNTMSAFEGTKLDADIKSGAFVPATEKEILAEEKALLEALDLPGCYFWAVHPLDLAKIDGYLPKNRQEMLDELTRLSEKAEDVSIDRVSRTGTL